MFERSSTPAGPGSSHCVGLSGFAPALFLLLLPIACVAPSFRGYQIQQPPEGFLYDASSSEAQLVFPDREVLSQSSWWRMNVNDQQASIFVTRFRGATTVDEVEEARSRYESAVARSGGGEVTQLQFLRIDGREAWGWEERRRSQGEIVAVAYRTVVLYDTMAVSLEFYSDMPEFMDPSLQRATLTSFGYGETRILWGWIILLILACAALVVAFFRRVTGSTAGSMTTTDYDLPSISTGPEEEGGTGGSPPGIPDEDRGPDGTGP